MGGVFDSLLLAPFNLGPSLFFGAVLFLPVMYGLSRAVEGRRTAADRTATHLIAGAFVVTLLPLASLVWETLSNGIARFDAQFFTWSMRNVIGEAAAIYHAIFGTLLVTGVAA